MSPDERRKEGFGTPDGTSNRIMRFGVGRWTWVILLIFVFVAAILVFGTRAP